MREKRASEGEEVHSRLRRERETNEDKQGLYSSS